MNRLGDGQIDYDWEFTYCQGVFVGVGLELYLKTGDRNYVEEALRTAEVSIDRLCDPDTLMLPDEGIDDTGLFKGILIRYLVQLLQHVPENTRVREVIMINAQRFWEMGLNEHLDCAVHRGRMNRNCRFN